MTLEMFKSKIHRATVTMAELYYEGSITIDTDLLKAAEILPFEKVQVVNVNNGSRLETYTLEGEAGSGIICLNGPAARLGAVGDEVVVITYAHMSKEEAEKHCNYLTQIDKYFDIFIGKIGELYSYDTDINNGEEVKYRDDKLQKIIDKHKKVETNINIKSNNNYLQRKQELLDKLCIDKTYENNREKLLNIIKQNNDKC